MTTTSAPGSVASGLALAGVSVCYGDSVVVGDIDLDVRAGEFLVVMGRSGCGKSTLLRALAGLLPPRSGELLADDRPIRPGTGALVFQEDGLLPWRTVRGNIELPLSIHGVPRTERAARAGEWIERVGLAGHERRLPGALSGGMRQRVQLARALVGTPGVLLMDEPFSALDRQSRTAMQRLLLDVWDGEPVTVVFVTHDIAEALVLADRIVVLSGEPARIVADLRVTPDQRTRTADDTASVTERLTAALEQAGEETD